MSKIYYDIECQYRKVLVCLLAQNLTTTNICILSQYSENGRKLLT